MNDLETIVAQWHLEKVQFDELGSFIKSFLTKKIFESGLNAEVSYRTKDLVSIIKKIKKKRKEKEYSLTHLKDKLGLRIICNYNSDILIIDSVIKKCFDVENVEYKKEELDFDKLGYTSNHYDVKLLGSSSEFEDYRHLNDLIFEIQVRTLNQHAWSNIVHELSYKQEKELGHSLKRRIYRLSSLYEIADDEFESVNTSIKEGQDVEVISLLKITEPYIYRFAKIDYDRETSLYTINHILKYLEPEDINQIKVNLTNFISTNEDKIQNIFLENRHRYHEIPFLTQPEVFLIWYCLEYHEFSIGDNWSTHSDLNDLEQVQAMWGIVIE